MIINASKYKIKKKKHYKRTNIDHIKKEISNTKIVC